jgi:hypothetical protein
MHVRETRKLAKTMGAAAALLAVPVAQARLDPGAEAGTPVIRTDARHAALSQRTGARVVIVKQSAESIAQTHGHLAQLNSPAGTTATASSSSFDWSDAGIGAGVGLGVALIAGGGVLITRRKLVSA